MKEPKIRLKGFRGEWKTYRIGELTSITTGATPSTSISSYWDNGTIRWMNSGELNNRHIYDVKGRITEEGYHSCGTHLIPQFCVMIGLAGQGKTRGTAAINHVELCTNQSIAALLPNPKLFDSSYLYHYIDNKYIELRGLSTGGGGRGGLNKQILLDFEVKLPSMEEQKALASYLDSIDSLIQSTTKKIESLKQVKAASLQSMFPQEGETTPRVRFKGFEGEWKTSKLGKIAHIHKGEQINKSMLQDYGDYYVLNGGIEASGFTSRYNTEKNTISISEGGNSCGYVNFNFERFWSGGHNYTLHNVTVDNQFLFSFLKYKETEIMKKRVGSGLPNIQKSALNEFDVCYPSDINEQIKIGQFFISIDKQISYQTQRLEKLKQIKSACLDNMFV